MAMVAGAVANGGVEMTPHVMRQIRDSQGDLVKVYQPKQWLQPISAETAATLTTFMQGVVPVRHCRSGGIPGQLGRGRQDRYRPDRLVRSQPPYTNDWLIAFAPVGNTRRWPSPWSCPTSPAAPPAPSTPDPIVKQILGDVLAPGGVGMSRAPGTPTDDDHATTDARRGTMRTPEPSERRPRL